MMKRAYLGSPIAAAFLLLSVTASAVPVVFVDMDPTTAGIQFTSTVEVGEVFTVDVVISDSVATTTFDSVILEVFFNDAGAVLGPGPTGPIGGTLASNSPSTFDVFAAASSATGAPLTVGPSSAPAGGFADGGGAVGLGDPFLFNVGTSLTSIFSIDFTASALGTSTILATGTGPFGSPELTLGGDPVYSIPLSSSVSVVIPTPPPSTMLLLGSGLAGLGFLRRRKKREA